LAKNFNLNTIAEGVEDQDTFDLLRDLGCELVQGFLYSRALSDTDFINWYRQHTLALHTSLGTSINPKS
jgi:diguanylate cyclase